jgi:IS30 family transposase
MTDDELDLMERLWRAGMPSKQIARLLGYSDHTIRARACRDRERFPYRRRVLKGESK